MGLGHNDNNKMEVIFALCGCHTVSNDDPKTLAAAKLIILATCLGSVFIWLMARRMQDAETVIIFTSCGARKPRLSEPPLHHAEAAEA